MSTIDKSLASIIPYGHILDDGTVYLRGRGWMVGFEFHGLPWESSTQAQLESASERMTEAMRHLGTGDMLQAVFHRLPSVHYPDRTFPSEAARLIDNERRSQFEAEHYWQTRSRGADTAISGQQYGGGRTQCDSQAEGSRT